MGTTQRQASGRKHSLGRTVVWLLIPILAAGMFIFATSSGIGLVSDSFFYIGGSEGILSGEGFSRPAAEGNWKIITHFPPFYAVLLSLPRLFLPSTDAAIALHLVLYVINAVLAGHLVQRATGNWLSGWLAGVLWSLSPVLLRQQISVLSEGLSFTMILLFLLHFQTYAQTRRWVDIAFAGVLVGFNYLTRYAGAAFILPGIIFLLIDGRSKVLDRITRLLLFLFTSLALPSVWALRNFWLTGSTSNRVLGWHPFSKAQLFRAAQTMVHWLSPVDFPGIVDLVLLGALLLMVGVLFLTWALRFLRGEPQSRDRSSQTMLLLSASVLSYLALLVVSISLFDASTPLDDRILSPVYVLLLLMAFLVLGRRAADRLPGKRLLLLVAILLTLWIGFRGARAANEAARYPAGFASATWQDSPVVGFVQELDVDTLLYSNEIDALYLLTGRMAYLIPVQWDPVTTLEREDYEEVLTKMRQSLHAKQGYLVLFSTLEAQPFFPDRSVLTEGMTPVLESDSGSIYRFD